MKQGDLSFILDALIIICVSVAICFAAHQLAFMSIFVPSILALRMIVWGQLARRNQVHSVPLELLLILICTFIGAFNDWNSVVRHQIYHYSVPHYFPAFSTIPLWMLLFWGMILRFFISLFQLTRFHFDINSRNNIQLGRFKKESPGLKIGLEMMLLILTRQAIYHYYQEPILSWLPFAGALAIYLYICRPEKQDMKLLLLFAIGGPIIEALYINVGHLHYYYLGWLGGVPLWILLWWMLAILIWKDLAGRLLSILVKNDKPLGRLHGMIPIERGVVR